jgi:CheY-like chemotaxis protein
MPTMPPHQLADAMARHVQQPTSSMRSGRGERASWNPKGDRTCRVVLVEDQDDLRTLTSMVLRARGHLVAEAANGLTGVETIERECPDVAFVDLGLPELSGYDIARRVRAQSQLASVFLVALTGYVARSDIQAALASGFDLHIAKPATAEVLERVLRLASRVGSPGDRSRLGRDLSDGGSPG